MSGGKKLAYELRYENDGRGLVVVFTGGVISDEVVTAVVDMYGRDDVGGLRYSVWDFSRIERLDLSEEKLRKLGMLDKQAAAEILHQKVVLIGTDAIFQGSDKRYAIYAEVWAGFEVGVFAEIEAARHWLAARFPDIPVGDIAPEPD